MRIGVSLGFEADAATFTGAGYKAALKTAEEVGYDGIWFFDALARGRFRPDAVSGMAAAAAVTDKVELGTCILQVPLRHPFELAHRLLGVHFISGGRVRLGVGAGSTEADFTAVDGDFATRFKQLTAALPHMQALWNGETVNGAALSPWPAAKGGPPIMIGSWAGSRWIPIAAKKYDGWIASAHFTNVATLEEGLKRYRGEGGTRTIACNIPVDFSAESKPLGPDDHLTLRCSPEEGAARLQRLADIGFDDAIVTVHTHTPEHMAQVRALYR